MEEEEEEEEEGEEDSRFHRSVSTGLSSAAASRHQRSGGRAAGDLRLEKKRVTVGCKAMSSQVRLAMPHHILLVVVNSKAPVSCFL